MLKYGSSNVLWLCLTIQVPVANLVFGIPGMPSYQPITWEAGLGLVVIMAGLVSHLGGGPGAVSHHGGAGESQSPGRRAWGW